jgi:hypothetical protein
MIRREEVVGEMPKRRKDSAICLEFVSWYVLREVIGPLRDNEHCYLDSMRRQSLSGYSDSVAYSLIGHLRLDMQLLERGAVKVSIAVHQLDSSS